jgi:hypothetical protein
MNIKKKLKKDWEVRRMNDEKKKDGWLKSELAVEKEKVPEQAPEPEQSPEEKLIEDMDMEQIRAEMAGKIIEEYAYRFKHGSREIVGLSYTGVMAAARKQGNITIEKPEIEETDKDVTVHMVGVDIKNNVRIRSIARQAKFYKTGQPDDFALVKAFAKAQRNVLRRLINEPIAKAILEVALKKIDQDRKDARAFMPG